MIRQEDAVRRQLVRWVKVMVGGFDDQAAFATPAIVADQHRGFRIHRQAQHRFVGLVLLAKLFQVGKDRVGYSRFFWGRLFCTGRSR